MKQFPSFLSKIQYLTASEILTMCVDVMQHEHLKIDYGITEIITRDGVNYLSPGVAFHVLLNKSETHSKPGNGMDSRDYLLDIYKNQGDYLPYAQWCGYTTQYEEHKQVRDFITGINVLVNKGDVYRYNEFTGKHDIASIRPLHKLKGMLYAKKEDVIESFKSLALLQNEII